MEMEEAVMLTEMVRTEVVKAVSFQEAIRFPLGVLVLPRANASLEDFGAVTKNWLALYGLDESGVIAVIVHGEAIEPTHEVRIVPLGKRFVFFGKQMTRRCIDRPRVFDVDVLVLLDVDRGFSVNTGAEIYDHGDDGLIIARAGQMIRALGIDRVKDAFDDTCDGCRDPDLQSAVRDGLVIFSDKRYDDLRARLALAPSEKKVHWSIDGTGKLTGRHENKGIEP